MSKAKELAKAAWADYEYREHPQGLYHTCFCDGYMQGREQAEKDFAPTWEDMKLVIAAEGSIYDEHHGNSHEVLEAYPTEEAFYGDVLKRYYKLKREYEKDNSI